jgi:hypothetical protein
MVGAIGLCLAGFFAGTTTGQKQKVSLPRFSLHYHQTGGYLDVRGTWQLETKDDAWPTQTTTLHCERANRTCQEATVVITEIGLLPVEINSLAVKVWTDTFIEVCGSTAMAVSERYLIDLADKAVSGFVGPRNGEDCPLTIKKRMKMIDGPRG